MMKVYSIKDDKSQTWQGCYPYLNDGLAIRDFNSMFDQNKLGIINQYPGDFSLYCLGTMDENTGKLSGDLKLVITFESFTNKGEVVHNG